MQSGVDSSGSRGGSAVSLGGHFGAPLAGRIRPRLQNTRHARRLAHETHRGPERSLISSLRPELL